MTIVGTFLFPLDHAHSFRKEGGHTIAPAANLDSNKYNGYFTQ